jgi:hypothetical protein
MTNLTFEEIKAQAEAEIIEEDFRKAVDACKEKLRAKKWYHKLMPYKIVLIKRED